VSWRRYPALLFRVDVRPNDPSKLKVGMLKALRQRMKDASGQLSEAKQSASSRAAATELGWIIEGPGHPKGIIPPNLRCRGRSGR
jgi:hypothetical protein